MCGPVLSQTTAYRLRGEPRTRFGKFHACSLFSAVTRNWQLNQPEVWSCGVSSTLKGRYCVYCARRAADWVLLRRLFSQAQREDLESRQYDTRCNVMASFDLTGTYLTCWRHKILVMRTLVGYDNILVFKASRGLPEAILPPKSSTLRFTLTITAIKIWQEHVWTKN